DVMLSIVVSWRDRNELGRALPGLIGAARATGGDVTVVNFGGSPDLLREQLGDRAGDVSVVEIRDQEFFNKARAQNLGAAYSTHPYLFFCDCDIVLEPETVTAIVERLDAQPGTFATLAGVRESDLNSRGGRHVVSFGYELRIRTAAGRELRIVDSEEDAQ